MHPNECKKHITEAFLRAVTSSRYLAYIGPSNMFHSSVSWIFTKSHPPGTYIDILKGLETCPSVSRVRQREQSVLNALLVTIVTGCWQLLPVRHTPSKLGAMHHAVSPYLEKCSPSIFQHCLSAPLLQFIVTLLYLSLLCKPF